MRPRQGLIAACLASVLTAGCALGNTSLSDLTVTGFTDTRSQASATAPAAVADGQDSAAAPKDARSAVAYARKLKAKGELKAAAAVLDTADAGGKPDFEVAVERSLIALELGEPAAAETILAKAGPDVGTDWRALSGLGIAASSRGRQKEAQGYFRRALVLSPANPAVLNNLAMSYILDKNIPQAEKLLKQASAAGNPPETVTRNLRLVTALKGEAASRL